ncbi:acetylornithine/succinylornithine aminotransferase [Methanomethylovorans hollandica DSM 15978]|uniref:Acetylornithine aminotransferase n=1 Tax=Methanomethylovorans hollandica (strain DSM 15978 / NBRC 107637 / DMS1) TaxID=867904 RepID=L0KTF2_METHD|nr:acetylornithine transaminase [Methanomethylovorans hollandica]AGB48717.1 acetylornithine/succinylornithine aminotransferase [Methanomethylovorans hollandica DSM 15978]
MSSINYESITQKDAAHVMQTYGRQPIVLASGQGAVVRDVNGVEYIDCVAGIAVNNVGHCHPRVVDAIRSQAEKLIHVSNLYYTEVQANLAEELVKLTGMERAFFCNSGAEAVEAAMKLARVTTGKTDFIAAERSFHGRTMGSLSVTYKEMYRAPFKPLVQEEIFVPYDNASAMAEAITENTAAIIIEPIQGEGGINVPSEGYLQEVRRICDDHGILLIFDEVQTGFGRTGKWFCKDHFGIQPDIMCMAKAMGGGFPMGGIVAKKGITFSKGQHASTFGGNPLACAAALGSIAAIKEDGLLKRTTELGKYFMDKLRQADIPGFKEVRGRGLMIGLELERNCTEIVDHARKHGVLLNSTSETVLRLAPPLVIDKGQIDRVVEVIEQA